MAAFIICLGEGLTVNLALIRRIDELCLDYPVAGSRMLQGLLRGDRLQTGRLHLATLMKKMGIEAIYRRPNTSKPAPGHKIYPYLLRKLAVTRLNQVWAMDLTYIPMARGFVYLCAIVDRFSRKVLSRRISITMEAAFCIEAVEEALAKYGKPDIFDTDQGSQFTPSASRLRRRRLRSLSRWAARVRGEIMCSSNGSGGRSNTKWWSTSRPTSPSPRPAFFP